MPTFSHLPQDGNLNLSVTIGADQAGVTKGFNLAAAVLNPPATLAEIRAGTQPNRFVDVLGLSNELNALFNENSHEWDNWSDVDVREEDENDYGTQLLTGLRTGADGAGHTEFDPRTLVTTGTALYSDMALVYNGGFVDGVNVPPVPAVGSQWELGLVWRATASADSQGAGLWLAVFWRNVGTRLYHSASVATPTWVEVSLDNDIILHHPRGIRDGSGWLVVASTGDELPRLSAGQNDFATQPWIMKRVGNTLHALALGRTDSHIYRLAVASREWGGSGGFGVATYIVDAAAELPSSPPVDTIAIVRTAFGSYTTGQRLYYNGTTWATLPTPQASIADGSLALVKLSTAGASTGQVVTRTSTGIAWQTPATGGGSGHPHTVSAGVQNVPDSWAVNDWVYNTAENSITLGRGTDDNNPLDRKSIYRITAFGANSLNLNKILLHGSTIVGRQSIAVNKWSAGDATNGQIAQVATINENGTDVKQVVFGDLPSNSVGYTQINDPAKAANRILHYNAAGTGITSSPHSAFDIAATQLTSGTIPPARYGTNIPAANLSGQIGTDNLPTTIPLDNIPVLNSSKFPDDIAAGIAKTDNLDDQFESVGIYEYQAFAENSPAYHQPGILFAHHNDQTAIITGNRLDGADADHTNTAGRIYTRGRSYTVGTLTGITTLNPTNGLFGFTELSNSSNFNTISNGFAKWIGSTSFADSSRPLNSPGWGAGLQTERVGTVFTNDVGQIALVGGGSSSNSPIRLQVRLRDGDSWEQSGGFFVWYSANADVFPRLAKIGLNVVTSLHQLRTVSNQQNLSLWIPGGETSAHPRAINDSNLANSAQPIWVSRHVVSNQTQVRFVWNFGGLSGTNTVLEVRTGSAAFTLGTPSAWDLVDDNSVTSGTYSSTNGTLTLTKADATTVTITGLPYITSS